MSYLILSINKKELNKLLMPEMWENMARMGSDGYLSGLWW
ncbi:unnamed protein product [marine sediment metagenome]|uniref:Uncharacterized protein n=1 Tax=marine sediment metagenome TaxID=412755 RepID=X1B0N2_9ZZZZ